MVSAADLTAVEMLSAFRTGELSPTEATAAVLERIERVDPEVNAFCLVDPEQATRAAKESTERWAQGTPTGLVDGVPTSIKDVLLTAGWPTLRGSRSVSPAQSWTEDGPSVARLREQGAVLVGKTTTPELAWKGVTDGPLYGVTRNPWDTARTAGGSSGGGAAAVALGMAPLTVGTDGGGSVRIPASFCGVFAHKPTYGWVPHHPQSPFGTLAHVGPMTTSVADAALLLDVIARPDTRDWSTVPPPATSFLESLDSGVSGLRIAFSPTLGYVRVDPEVSALVAAAARVFEELGAEVEEVDPGFTDPVAEFHTLWFAGAAKSVEHLTSEQRAELDPGLREITERAAAYSAGDYLDAIARRAALGAVMGRFHERYDLLLTPTMPIPPFEAGLEVPPGWPGDRWTSWCQFTYPFNMTQQPAASVPCGFTSDGLPVGLQVVGGRYTDHRVLAACHAFEGARPWRDRRPPLV
ncbi:amidase [Actinoalloteichus spitiensis]|uniref:amidase n=1 Tax=Actinoalloteichus spitiensis TaxID=252394 RepID=UPI000A2F107D|nr:amidase [Actinoalloteichus spitiensis]